MPHPGEAEGSTAAIACLLLAAVFVAMRHDQRKQALQPAVLLLLAGLVRLLEEVVIDPLSRSLPAIELFFLYASIVRSAFLFAITAMSRVLQLQFQKIFLDVVMALAYVVIGFFALQVADVKPGDIFTGSAIITLIVGLALKSTLGSIFCGLTIQLHQPFATGDWIQFEDLRDHFGKVRDSNWRATTVVTLEEIEVVIPNTRLAELPLTNLNRPERWARRSIYFVCPYSIPPREVQRIILEAIPGSFGVLETPAPSVVTNSFTARGIEYWLRFFTTELDQRNAVDNSARTRVWYALDRRGIKIPVARHHVHVSPHTVESDRASDDSPRDAAAPAVNEVQ